MSAAQSHGRCQLLTIKQKHDSTAVINDKIYMIFSKAELEILMSHLTLKDSFPELDDAQSCSSLNSNKLSS